MNQIEQLVKLIQGNYQNRKKDKEKDHGGAPAPKTATRVGPDRRAQAVLRAANRPKSRITSRDVTRTTIFNPAVGIQANKDTFSPQNDRGTESTLSFNRFKPGDRGSRDYQLTDAYSTKGERRRWTDRKPQTAQELHKDRLRSAAVKHAMGRQMTDVRPGNDVEAHAIRSLNKRNPRGRIYENMTNGALNFERGKNQIASSTKLTKDTWRPHNLSANGPDHPTVRFNPNDLKNPLKALAQMSVVRATSRLIGGPYAQPVTAVDDAVAAATGKRPSKEIAKEHIKTQSKLVADLQKRKRFQSPWVNSGPF